MVCGSSRRRNPGLIPVARLETCSYSIFSWVAQQERNRISERTKAGLDRARRRGRQLGRPKKIVDVERAIQLRASGMSIRKAAKRIGVGASTLCRALQVHDAEQKISVPKSGTPEAL